MKIFFTIISLAFTQFLQSQSGWILQNSGQSYWDLNSICFINPNTGFAVGNHGTLSKTINGGENWNLQNTGNTTDFKGICFPSQNTGYIAGSAGVLGKTTNSGINWIMYSTGSNATQYALYFLDNYTGFISCSNGMVIKTTNGGLNWSSSNIGAQGYLYSVYFINANTGLVAGYIFYNANIGIIFKTTDGGNSWFESNYPAINIFYSIFFSSPDNGYCSGWYINYPSNAGILLKTTDLGNNWVLHAQPPYYLTSVYFIDDYIGYSVGSLGEIIKTTNNGNNWILMNDSATSNILNGVCFINYDTGYAVGNSGTIIKTTTGGEPIGIKPISSQIPEQFNLFQNYPNPFNPITKIKFDISMDSRIRGNDNVVLKIYNILGKEIATLVNEKLQPGTYEIIWDASNYPSGVYFYKLFVSDPETSSGFIYSQTKKMVLIK